MSRTAPMLVSLLTMAALHVAVAASTAGVLVDTQPATPGASVRVDGIRQGSTDQKGRLFIDRVERGTHRVQLELADGRLDSLDVVVHDSPLATRLTFRISPAPPVATPVTLWIRANIPDALVEIDGSPTGRTGQSTGRLALSLAPGTYNIRVSAEGYGTVDREVTLRSSPSQQAVFELRRAGSGGLQGMGDFLTWALLIVLALAVVVVSVLLVYLLRQPATGRITTRGIDRYEVREVIGRGGMAIVYRATDSLNPRNGQLALKVMDEGFLRDPDLVHKFLREGQILQQFNESDPEAPLVRVFHWGQAGGVGVPFIAMELLEGENLLQALRRQGRLPVSQAIHVVSGVARALVPAHAVGIYHRDLTPDNVILTDSSRGGYNLRLIDFGVARHEYTSHGTLDGSITGKPPYMSPEQCQGVPVDGRSDIYSLGIMLYTLIVGIPPFMGRNPLEVMRMHKESAVPYPDSVPPAVRSLLVLCLAKEPGSRFRDLEAFRRELAGLEKL